AGLLCLDSSSPSALVELAQLAASDQTVSWVLQLVDAHVSGRMAGLYLIFEQIRAAVGGKDALLQREWMGRGQSARFADDLERFSRTVDNPDVLGTDARHGVKGRHPPPKRPMSYEEGR